MAEHDNGKEIQLKEIGEKIKAIRVQKNLKLKDLSDLTGLSNGFLSQVENGQAQISLGNLWKIAQVLEVHLGTFFEDLKSSSLTIVRREERKKLTLPKSNVSYRLLSPDLNRKIEMILIELNPGDYRESHEQITHEGEECGYVINGRLGIFYGGKEVILEQGDSVYFDSVIPHRFFNPGPEKSISVWAITPPSF